MANWLRMAQVHAIEGLWMQGWSRRRIARELGLDRATVRKYIDGLVLQTQNQPNLTSGKLADLSPNTGLSAESENPKPATNLTAGSPGPPSKSEVFRDVIVAKLELGLSAQRIYQDLLAEKQFPGSYESVKRFVRKLEAAIPLPFRRMGCGPGKECQVDFGKGAWVRRENGKRKRPWLFRIILSHSRKGYSEAVWKQTTEAFLRALENAFWSWGGVPKVIVLDNLRAAVTRADWFDPELNPKIEEFARHYGTVFMPTKSYTPRHKGKVESGVGYAQDNGLRGKEFEGLQAHNEGLWQWEAQVADLRIHGTTKRQVKKQFEEVERPALLPLPAERFPYFLEGQRKVHTDGHVEVAGAYYSVPPEYYRHQVWVRYDSRLVRIFDLRLRPIATHVRAEPGKFSTEPAHIASQKISRVEKGAEYLLRRASLVGPKTALWAKAVLEERGIRGIRILNGLLSFTTRYSAAQMEAACDLAVSHGAYRLRALRELLSRPSRQENFEFMEEHPLIRKMADYQDFIQVNFKKEGS